MATSVFRDLSLEEVDRIVEIDRMEHIDAFYRQDGRDIRLEAITPFDGGWDDLPETIEFCRDHMRRGARAVGAFDGDSLIGIAMVTPNIAPGMAQLSFLHVSASWRRHGLGAQLFQTVLAEARNGGHAQIYVTATPTRSAVGFYLGQGFVPTDEPIPELLALEPEDIHMILAL